MGYFLTGPLIIVRYKKMKIRSTYYTNPSAGNIQEVLRRKRINKKSLEQKAINSDNS